MCYKDRMFCASPNCTNECGRKITDEQRLDVQRLDLNIAFAYFCDFPDPEDEKNKTLGARK